MPRLHLVPTPVPAPPPVSGRFTSLEAAGGERGRPWRRLLHAVLARRPAFRAASPVAPAGARDSARDPIRTFIDPRDIHLA